LKIFSDINGGSLKIRGFNILLSTTENITLEVWRINNDDGTDGEQLITYNLVSEANKNKINYITPLEIDFDGSEYYFIFQSTGNVLKNKLTCGCGGYKWCYTLHKPFYAMSRDRWTAWMMVGGVNGSDLTDFDSFTTSHYANGLSIIADTRCKSFEIVCNDGSDFINDPVAISIAMAILYKSGEYLLDAILDTNEVNRYTLLTPENIDANRLFFQGRYAELIKYIGQEINFRQNDCWRCKDKVRVRGQLL
jgi:hypothetical protein